MRSTILRSTLFLLGLCLTACQQGQPISSKAPATGSSPTAVASPTPSTSAPGAGAADPMSEQLPSEGTAVGASSVATFGAGCFWCTEAVLEQLDGVLDVSSGYMGGDEAPNYKLVSTGTTQHAEVVQVHFDPKRISYESLCEWFWQLHDPTTLNRQGADVGPQYRSVIFYADEDQRRIAEASKRAAQADFSQPIVTEISPAKTYYPGEEYHQDYYRNNKSQGYCRAVIAPKLKKLKLEY